MRTPWFSGDIAIDEKVEDEINDLIDGLWEEHRYTHRILCDLENLLSAIFDLAKKA